MDTPGASTSGRKKLDALAKFLGVKGSLRLVPQGSTPKPHVVIKRDFSKDAEEDGESSGVAHFSFIAGKKFTVSKGQPLLFAVASPEDRDGKKLLGDDNTFLLQATIEEEEEETDDEEGRPSKKRKKLTKRQQQLLETMPPKMRKSFAGKRTYDSYIERFSPTSLGFPGFPLPQANRVFVTAQVQTDAVEEVRPTSGTEHVPPSVANDDNVGKSPMQLPSPVSADHAREVISEPSAPRQEIGENARVERSLSPMDLSSTSSTPAASPMPSARPPQETKVADVSHEANIPCSVPPAPAADQLQGLADNSVQPKRTSPPSSPIPPRSIPDISKPKTPEQMVRVTRGMPEVVQPKTPGHAQAAAPAATSRASEIERPPVPTWGVEKDVREPTMAAPPSVPSPRPDFDGVRIKKEMLSSEEILSNAIASSSRSPTQPKTQSSREVTNISTGQQPKQTGYLTARALEKLPVPRSPPKQPMAMTNSMRGYTVSSTARRNSPPPDPKAVAYIPQTSSHNPLGIRPSSGRPVPVTVNSFKPTKPVPIGPRSLVASGWGRNNNNGGGKKIGNQPVVRSSSSASSSSNGSSMPHPPPTNPASLSQLSRYVSPSPPPPPQANPPPPPPPPAVQSSSSNATVQQTDAGFKWKPIPLVYGKNAKESVRGAGVPKKLMDESGDTKKQAVVPCTSSDPSPSLKRSLSSCQSEKEKNEQSGDEPASKKMKGLHPLMASTFVKATAVTTAAAATTAVPPSTLSTPTTTNKTPTVPAAPANGIQASTSTSSVSSVSSPVVPSLKTSLPITHPLPPKPPAVQAVGSSYRPVQVKRERERDWDLRDLRDLRDRERTPEPVETKRTATTAASSSSNSNSNPSTNTKRSESNWPSTNCSAEYQLQGQAGEDLGVRSVCVSADGTLIAVACADRTLRIWENTSPAMEIARLSHNSALASVCWMYRDSAVMTLTVDGTISTWTRNGKEWKFTKLIAVPDVAGMAAKNEKPCLAYAKDQIAVSTQTGVKVWLVIDGIWRPQRDINRSGVTVIRFVQDGKALVGGCKDSVLWYCEVPNGALRVYAFLPKPIHSIDIHPSGTYLLVGVEDGLHLLTLKSNENTGKIEQSYKSEKALAQMGKRKGFPAVFATRGQAILYGMINDCALVWDRRKGSIVYGLKHPNGDHVLAAATYDGRPGVEGLMITGTKQGRLFWWPQPVAQANANTAAQSGSGSGTPNDSMRKRAARP